MAIRTITHPGSRPERPEQPAGSLTGPATPIDGHNPKMSSDLPYRYLAALEPARPKSQTSESSAAPASTDRHRHLRRQGRRIGENRAKNDAGPDAPIWDRDAGSWLRLPKHASVLAHLDPSGPAQRPDGSAASVAAPVAHVRSSRRSHEHDGLQAGDDVRKRTLHPAVAARPERPAVSLVQLADGRPSRMGQANRRLLSIHIPDYRLDVAPAMQRASTRLRPTPPSGRAQAHRPDSVDATDRPAGRTHDENAASGAADTADWFEVLASHHACPAVCQVGVGGRLTAGSAGRLVMEITSADFVDYDLLSDFFLTFRNFMTATELVDLIFGRLGWAISRRQTGQGQVIRVRAFVALRHWLLNYFADDFVDCVPLRVRFCVAANRLYRRVQQDELATTGDVRIVVELKKCWVRMCSAYTQEPVDRFECVDSDIQPGCFDASPTGAADHIVRLSRLSRLSQLPQVGPDATTRHDDGRTDIDSLFLSDTAVGQAAPPTAASCPGVIVRGILFPPLDEDFPAGLVRLDGAATRLGHSPNTTRLPGRPARRAAVPDRRLTLEEPAGCFLRFSLSGAADLFRCGGPRLALADCSGWSVRSRGNRSSVARSSRAAKDDPVDPSRSPTADLLFRRALATYQTIRLRSVTHDAAVQSAVLLARHSGQFGSSRSRSSSTGWGRTELSAATSPTPSDHKSATGPIGAPSVTVETIINTYGRSYGPASLRRRPGGNLKMLTLAGPTSHDEVEPEPLRDSPTSISFSDCISFSGFGPDGVPTGHDSLDRVLKPATLETLPVEVRAIVAELAQLPDEPDGSVEAALRKLEGRGRPRHRGSDASDASSTGDNGVPLPPGCLDPDVEFELADPIVDGHATVKKRDSRMVLTGNEKPFPAVPMLLAPPAIPPRSGSLGRHRTAVGHAADEAVPPLPSPTGPARTVGRVPSRSSRLSSFRMDHAPFVLDLDPELVAEQMTLIERDLLHELNWRELIDITWTVDGCDVRDWSAFLVGQPPRSVDVIFARFNLVVKWVVSEIALTDSAARRAAVISRFIQVAGHAKKLRNYATVYQITLALLHPDISGLKTTWDCVCPADMQVLADLEELTDPRRNFYNFRAAMDQPIRQPAVTTGCIPFLGIFTHDLVFNAEKADKIAVTAARQCCLFGQDGESTCPAANVERPQMHDGGGRPTGSCLINFDRFQAAALVVKNLLRLIEAAGEYRFGPVPTVLGKCLWLAALEDDEITALCSLAAADQTELFVDR